jgi:large subunit ribosomal protein L9
MKVIFVKDVPGSGNAGDVKEVKNGYGRNYLLPKSFALLASHDNLQRLNSIKKAGDEQRIKEEQDQNELAKLLNDMEFELSEKVNSSGKFYGSINNTMISEKIESETERSLDRKLFVIENPIEEPGIYTIGINFPRGAECSIKIKVSGIDIQGNIVEVQEISEQEIIETTGNLDITEDIVELSDSETTNEPVSEESSSSPQSEVKEDNNEEIA